MSATILPALKVKVLLFASYADNLGFDTVELALETPARISDVLERLRSFPGGDRLPPKPLCALNLCQARADALLTDGDELALLPPLSGG